MIDEQKIKQLLDYRMQSVTTLNLVLNLGAQWQEAPSISVYIDDRLVLEGNLNAITNPMIEAGFVHCRALLEFLGLRDKNGLLSQINDRRNGDVGVEHFQNAKGHLKKVAPSDAMARYKGDSVEAEKALLKILHVTNKGLAHTTMNLTEDLKDSNLVEIASRGVPSLMVSYYYTPLSLLPPDSKITTRARNLPSGIPI